MITYFVFAAFFILLTGARYCFREWGKLIDILVLVLFVGIAGLRYQTGYDWLVYEEYFYAIYESARCYQGPAMEPLYWFFNLPFALLGLDVSFLFFTIALLNGFVFYYFCRFFGVGFAYPAAFYFLWIYPTLQMAVLRQSLAVSLFLIACIALLKGGYVRMALSALASFGMQFSAVIYFPVLIGPFILRRVWSFFPMAVFVVSIASLIAKSAVPTVMQWLSEIGIPLVSEKMKTYTLAAGSPLSVAAAGYLALNIAFVFVVWWMYRERVPSRAKLLLLSPIVLLIFLQITFMGWPVLWNRMQYLAIPCQAVLLALMLRDGGRWREQIAFAFVGLGLANLGYFLIKPLAASYIPYRTVIFSYGTQDGRIRAEENYRTYLRENPEFYKNKLSQAAIANNLRRKQRSIAIQNSDSTKNSGGDINFGHDGSSQVSENAIEAGDDYGGDNSSVSVHEAKGIRDLCAKLSPFDLFGLGNSGNAGRK